MQPNQRASDEAAPEALGRGGSHSGATLGLCAPEKACTGRSLRAFADEIYATLADAPDGLPAPFRLFAARAARFDVLAGYAERERLEAVFMHLSERLSRANPVAHALPLLESLERPLERAFECLWVDLAGMRPAGHGLRGRE